MVYVRYLWNINFVSRLESHLQYNSLCICKYFRMWKNFTSKTLLVSSISNLRYSTCTIRHFLKLEKKYMIKYFDRLAYTFYLSLYSGNKCSKTYRFKSICVSFMWQEWTPDKSPFLTFWMSRRLIERESWKWTDRKMVIQGREGCVVRRRYFFRISEKMLISMTFFKNLFIVGFSHKNLFAKV